MILLYIICYHYTSILYAYTLVLYECSILML